MKVSVCLFVVATLLVVAFAQDSENEDKAYLTTYLERMGIDVTTLKGKSRDELIDLAISMLKKRLENEADPKNADVIQKHIESFEEMKQEQNTIEGNENENQQPANVQQKGVVHKVLTEAEFDDLVNNAGDKLVVVDFFATWCGPCSNIAPTVDKLAQKYAATTVIMKVDVDESDDLPMRFGVQSMPTFVFLKNGKQVEKFSGVDAGRIEKTINQFTK